MPQLRDMTTTAALLLGTRHLVVRDGASPLCCGHIVCTDVPAGVSENFDEEL